MYAAFILLAITKGKRELLMKKQSARSIRRISVRDLFGMYDYELTIQENAVEPAKIMIFYGDNGCGKTSILKIAFHLLAPEDGSGHKSEVAPIPFKSFEIELYDGSLIWAKRPRGKLKGSFSMGVKVKSRKERIVEFIAVEENIVRATSKEHDEQIRAFLQHLSELDISLYLLSDDRTIRLAGKKNEDLKYDTEFEEEWIYMDAENRARVRRRQQINPEQIAQQRLAQSKVRVEKWIRGRAILSSSIGESNVNTLYSEILRRLTSLPESKKMSAETSIERIEQRLAKLESRFKQFSQYNLLPEFSGKEIKSAVSSAPESQIEIIANVLNPYLESLEKKLEAMTEIYTRVNSLVSIVNQFLNNKRLSYDLHDGVIITAENGTRLNPSMMSSGERHLLLLFFNSFVAVDRPSILMIDEPELSLNIKWQRKLIFSLLDCIGDNPVQYLFATHSIEFLAQHKDRVIKLENRRAAKA